jgi:hypothetical protein
MAHASETPDEGTRRQIVLVRTDRDGNRSWAYIEGGAMPARFEDAYQRATADVPEQFLRAWARVNSSASESPALARFRREDR